MHILPRNSMSVKKAKSGLDRVEKFFENVKVRSLFGWGGFMILLVTGTPKKEEPKKDELTDDEIQDMVPGMGPFIFEKALQNSIPFLTPF